MRRAKVLAACGVERDQNRRSPTRFFGAAFSILFSVEILRPEGPVAKGHRGLMLCKAPVR